MKLTIREIRKILFDTEKYCVIGMYRIGYWERVARCGLDDTMENYL